LKRNRSNSRISNAVLAALLLAGCALQAEPQSVNVSARAEVAHREKHDAHPGSSDVVVWLTPLQEMPAGHVSHKPQEYTLAQKDKQFLPHLLVVPTGSSVNFPNLDPFFHNVFSLFNGKRFDLGLYEAHTHRTVQFDRDGVSFIFCNIHPDMGAVIVSLSTPFYGVSAQDGTVLLEGVPPGRYRLHVWAEDVPIDRLNELSRLVDISAKSNQLGTIRVQRSGDEMTHHLNKFGESYPAASKTTY
jgi:plastocyanin